MADRKKPSQELEGKEAAVDVTPEAAQEHVEPLDNGYSDVSGAVDAQREALANPERDEETGIVQVDTAPSAAIHDEQSKRATGSGEGGGRWPAEILRQNFLTPTAVARPAPEYTSHLDADEQ